MNATAANQVVLDPSIGETFTPSSTLPNTTLLTEAQARSAASKNAITPPASANVQTGYFTFPVGPGAPDSYHAKDAYVYAFSWAECQPGGIGEPIPVGGQATATAPPPTNCTEWVIIDAQSGQSLDITWTKG